MLGIQKRTSDVPTGRNSELFDRFIPLGTVVNKNRQTIEVSFNKKDDRDVAHKWEPVRDNLFDLKLLSQQLAPFNGLLER